MKRKVNECGESVGPLWLCVSLISGWWEAVWGRDGPYYCYGTLRTLCEALLDCLFCGQQYSRYKHRKQQLKGNNFSSPEKHNKFLMRIISFMLSSWKSGTYLAFLVPPILFLVVFNSFSSYTSSASPPSSLNLLFCQFFPICSALSLLFLHLCLFLCALLLFWQSVWGTW